MVLALVFALLTVLISPSAPADAGNTTNYIANCAVNLRTAASTSAAIATTIPTGTGITASTRVSGGSWSTNCVTFASGSSWYVVTAVNGRTVQSLYGVNALYAATGLFRPASYLEGIDVSSWQGTIDYAQVAASGKTFVIAKATEGIGYLDAYYSSNKTGAMNAGLAFTGYHFARPDLNPTNPTGEADWFVTNLGLVPGMIVPALDLETTGGLGTTDLQNWVAAWLGELYAETGVRAMIYTSPSFWQTYMGDTRWFADQGYTVLWVAHWFVSAPTVPASNWGGRSWTFWQYDDCGSVPGIGGCVDLDRYNGTDLSAVTVNRPSATFTAPAAGATVTSASSTNTITWSENSGGSAITARTLTEQYGPVVTPGSCAGVTWTTAWSGAYTSPFTTGGFSAGYCWRWTVSLTNGAGLTGSASSGNLLIQ